MIARLLVMLATAGAAHDRTGQADAMVARLMHLTAVGLTLRPSRRNLDAPHPAH